MDVCNSKDTGLFLPADEIHQERGVKHGRFYTPCELLVRWLNRFGDVFPTHLFIMGLHKKSFVSRTCSGATSK